MHHLILWNAELKTIQSKYISKFLFILNYALDILFSSRNVCVFAIAFQHGYGYCMRGLKRSSYTFTESMSTRDIAWPHTWRWILIGFRSSSLLWWAQGTQEEGWDVAQKASGWMLLGPKVSSSLTWSRALLMTQQVNIVVIEIISSTFDTNSLILVYAWGWKTHPLPKEN